jgi:DNA (cytosine-5)-methyltransferase 1
MSDKQIPIIDLFAGPGGLGEGFSAYTASSGSRPFRIALSIEKDPWAHQTLLLRAFRRQFASAPPVAYEALISGDISIDALADSFPMEIAAARHEAQLLELSVSTAHAVRTLVHERLADVSRWALIGGPPCQAYSLIGRSRNKGNSEYVAEADHRQTLYVEYLQVLADHAPPVFVMENVKGMLSARLGGQALFARIREDLEYPAFALRREGRRSLRENVRYRLYALVSSDGLFDSESPTDFLVRAEEFGVPQARHRVIILGAREDVAIGRLAHLTPAPSQLSVYDTLSTLPRLRSGVSKSGQDDRESWRTLLMGAPKRPWFRDVSSDVRARIVSTVSSLRVPRSDRGAEVLASVVTEAPVLNHTTRSHIPADLDRYLFSSCFALAHGRSPTLEDFPRGLMPAHASATFGRQGGHFIDRFRVQLKDRPSTTVTSHIAKDGHYYIHYDPSQCRSLTVREAARLQTFPDNYFFRGPRTSQYHQVGNAVPPHLAMQIARVVAALL